LQVFVNVMVLPGVGANYQRGEAAGTEAGWGEAEAWGPSHAMSFLGVRGV